MGVDLRLLVVEGRSDDCRFAHTIIDAGGGYDLEEAIKAAGPSTRPEWTDFTTWCSDIPDGPLKGESCYGKVTEDKYGNPLTFLSAEQLIEAAQSQEGFRRPALAYLKACNPKQLIGLYWH